MAKPQTISCNKNMFKNIYKIAKHNEDLQRQQHILDEPIEDDMQVDIPPELYKFQKEATQRQTQKP